MMTAERHTPVLLQEVLAWLHPVSGSFVIDGTLGSGGHAERIFASIGPGGMLLGLDWDPFALERAERRLAYRATSFHVRFRLVLGNYAALPEILKKEQLPRADGLLLDLGFSSEQIEGGGQGLSFLLDEPLDMRYGKDEHNTLSVAEVLRTFSEEDLAHIFHEFGEERFSRRIARAIVERRKRNPIINSKDLALLIVHAVPAMFRFRQRIHPATRVFQALRIFVNHELENLERALDSLDRILTPEGRVVIISFHSLEDRMVKRRFQSLAHAGRGTVLTKKPVTPSPEEVFENPRSRSAKLRAFAFHSS